MKCDELKALVFSISDLAYVDEPTAQPNFQNPHDHAVYKATDVDEAIAELKDKIKFCSDFEFAARKDIQEMRGQHQMLKQFGHYKLSPVPGKMINHEVRQYVSYNVVCMIINQLESENADLKQKLENVQASAYADSVDAGMRERRLKRALYKACANWAMNARMVEIEAEPWGENHESRLWAGVYDKCLKKAEEYR